MSTVQEIEQAICELSPSEVHELSAWMDERFVQAVDDRLKSDLEAGRFDAHLERALADHASGNTRPL